jgi:hypothetical protein
MKMIRIVLMLLSVAILGSASHATDVSGPVTGTWTTANNPYNVTDSIYVPTNQSLIIQPGVQVVFQGHYKFIVSANATLKALGTQQDSIRFYAADTSVGWWGIRFNSASDSCRLEYCYFTNGNATGGFSIDGLGGAVFSESTNIYIAHCTFSNNYTNYSGGAVCIHGSSNAQMFDCHITNNSTTTAGGGIDISGPAAILHLENCLITENSTAGYGGGIVSSGDVTITNCTIASNTAGAYCGGVNGSASIFNSIVFLNSAPTYPQMSLSANDTVNYTNVQGGWPGTGNSDEPPQFIEGYHLSQDPCQPGINNPCVNAGNPASPMITGTTRTDGVQDAGIVDMGYHYNPPVPPPPPSLVEITLTPVNPPIVIPAQGGSFQFDVRLEVPGDSSATFQAWIMQITPSWLWQGPMLGPVSLTLPAYAAVERRRTQNVPSTAQPGVYTYIGYVGIYPNAKWDSSFFTYTKLASGNGPIVVNTWENYGERFPGEIMASVSPQPSQFILQDAYPNPFNPTTAISYKLQASSYVSLKVYDSAGKLVTTLVNGWREAGSHDVTFDGSNLSSGIYFCRMQAGQNTEMQKLVLMK